MLSTTNNHGDLGTEKKTVMICDDEQELLQLFGLTLKSKYNIILVDSGEDCVDKYIEEKSHGNEIHLILLDYRLGGMLCDTVARKIKEQNGTKIILNSAYNVDDMLIKELENGNYISKYLQKPIETDLLTDLVTEIIKN